MPTQSLFAVIFKLFLIGFLALFYLVYLKFPKSNKGSKRVVAPATGFLLLHLFIAIAIINIIFTGTSLAWFLPKINPFLLGFLISISLKEGGIVIILLALLTQFENIGLPEWAKKYNWWYFILGSLLSLIINEIIKRTNRNKKDVAKFIEN